MRHAHDYGCFLRIRPRLRDPPPASGATQGRTRGSVCQGLFLQSLFPSIHDPLTNCSRAGRETKKAPRSCRSQIWRRNERRNRFLHEEMVSSRTDGRTDGRTSRRRLRNRVYGEMCITGNSAGAIFHPRDRMMNLSGNETVLTVTMDLGLY